MEKLQTSRIAYYGSATASRRSFRVYALFTKKGKKSQSEAPPKPKKQSFLSQFTEAIDFAQTRSEGDRQLLDSAKRSVGKKKVPAKGEKLEKGKNGREKMSPEQYAALRRKVGGTARDYWKDYIQADEVEGYRSSKGPNVQGLPFLLAVVLGLVVATGVVVSQTAGNPSNPGDVSAAGRGLPAAPPPAPAAEST